MKHIRRCVIGTGADGQSYTQFDDYAPVGMVLGKTGANGPLWVTKEMPVRNAGDDDRALGPFHPMPGPHGTVFSFLMFPPESEMDQETLAKTSRALGAGEHGAGAAYHLRQPGVRKPRLPGMHRTKTLDYGVILEGEVWLLTDTDEVVLKPGDTFVCRGANHTWRNRTDELCVAVLVTIDAEPLESV